MASACELDSTPVRFFRVPPMTKDRLRVKCDEARVQATITESVNQLTSTSGSRHSKPSLLCITHASWTP